MKHVEQSCCIRAYNLTRSRVIMILLLGLGVLVTAPDKVRGAPIVWESIYSSKQMEPDHGYITENFFSTIQLTLPLNPPDGTIIRIMGSSNGGWRINQNAGDEIFTNGLNIPKYETWIDRGNARTYSAIASSANGNVLAAASSTNILVSTDRGITWTPRASSAQWSSIAVSADGTKMAACVRNGQIYTSVNSGLTWTARSGAGTRAWEDIACSADGSKIVALGNGTRIYYSSNGGATWSAKSTTQNWAAVTCSANGNVVAAAIYSGYIYYSLDSGNTMIWGDASPANWTDLACSADGSKMVACATGNYLWTSISYGGQWAARRFVGVLPWQGVAMSADGTIMAAAPYGDGVYFSSDSGVTWLPGKSGVKNWSGVALSADGRSAAACVGNNGTLSTCTAQPITVNTPGIAGFLSGGFNSAIELQHIGSGLWMPLSSNGALNAK